MRCPECGSAKVKVVRTMQHEGRTVTYWYCKFCHAGWSD